MLNTSATSCFTVRYQFLVISEIMFGLFKYLSTDPDPMIDMTPNSDNSIIVEPTPREQDSDSS